MLVERTRSAVANKHCNEDEPPWKAAAGKIARPTKSQRDNPGQKGFAELFLEQQFMAAPRILLQGVYAVDGVYEFAVGDFFQRFEAEPFAVAPGGGVPAGE